MKSVMSRSALGRRVAATAVLGLAATSLSLGLGGSASADTGVTDLEGTVTGLAGAPVEGVHVEVFDATTGDSLGTDHTDAAGHYQLDALEFDGSVKIAYFDENSFSYTDPTHYLLRWYGGSRSMVNATPVALTTDGDKVANFAMTPAAIIAGTLAGPSGQELNDGASLDVLNSDLDYPFYADFDNSAWGYDFAPDGIAFRLWTEPGDMRIGGYGWSTNPTGPDTFYMESWWQNADTSASATPVTVASGQTVSGINLRPSNVLSARKAPSISGFAAVGRTLTADPGTWSRTADVEYTYTWMRGATVVGTGATYTPTVADFGQRLNVIVRAVKNFNNSGQAVSAQTDPVKWASDAKGTAKRAGSHKVRFAMKIKSAKQSPVKGKVVVLRGAKKVHKPVKLVKGKVVITVAGQPKGKQTYTVLFKGNKNIAKSSKTFTVRVK
jgi:hypothetical protein